MTATPVAPDLPVLENLGSLITFKIGAHDRCLGYLIDAGDKGVFDADLGKVPVTAEQAKAHNAAFDKASIDGLDNRCRLHQGNTFYLKKGKLGLMVVTTFIGTEIGKAVVDVILGERVVTFARGGKLFRGKADRDPDVPACFFARIT